MTSRYCSFIDSKGQRCERLVSKGRCDEHQKQHAQAYDVFRGTAASRGYDTRWSRYRKWFLEQWPFCGDRPSGAPTTQDSRCVQLGLPVKANVVDHIIPVTGPDDPSFYQASNQQSLCAPCHDRKRQRESITARIGHVSQ